MPVDAALPHTGYRHLAEGRLADVRRWLSTFGMTLARPDIRQAAKRHEDALAAVFEHLGARGYAQWDEQERIDALARELRDARLTAIPDFKASPEVRDVLDTSRMLAAIPRNSLAAYVITMASRASDVLAMLLIQQTAGISEPLRVVPLFETSRDPESLIGAGARVCARDDRKRSMAPG